MFDQYLTESPLAQRAVELESLANRLARSWPVLLPHLLEAAADDAALQFALAQHGDLIRELADACKR